MSGVMEEVCIKTVEMHTGGGPLRIVVSGLPTIPGDTILHKIQYIRAHQDHIRKLLIFEPRGHFDMYGVYLIAPDVDGADVGCIFFHNEGYSTMCGHAVISLGRYLVDHGIVGNVTSPETRIVMQCPCGPVESFVQYNNGKTGSVRFNSVPAYIYKKDVTVFVEDFGNVTVDIAYGGAFYGFVSAGKIGCRLDTSSMEEIRSAAGKLKAVLMKEVEIKHPESADLAFLYGIMVTDYDDEDSNRTATTRSHVCMFADKEIDRSPCGSGSTARAALQYFRGHLNKGDVRTYQGPSGSNFKAKVTQEVKFGSHDAVVVEISGRGHYTGSAEFTVESDDTIGQGFLLA